MRNGTIFERGHLYTGGEWVAPLDGGRIDVVNPATEAVIGHAPLASVADVDRAVAAARDAFEHGPWPHIAPETRADVLVAMAEYLRERARPLAELNIDEAGVPITFAHARELGPVAVFGYFEEVTRAFPWREVRQGALAPALVVREPVGVIGAVVPFNGPIMSAAAKLAPALASGCPIVFKPAPRRRSMRSCSRRRPRRRGSRPASSTSSPAEPTWARRWSHTTVSTGSSSPGAPRRVAPSRRRAQARSSG